MSKPAPFEYMRAERLDDVFAAFAAHGEGARILAGGQSLIPSMNLRLARPSVLIDINRLAELSGIERRGDTVRIGALVRHAGLIASPIISETLPLLALAMPHVAHPAVRQRGTFGGSLCQADPTADIPACLLALRGGVLLASARGRRTLAAEDFLLGMMETARAPDEVLIEAFAPVRAAGEVVAFHEIAPRRGDPAVVGVAARARLERGALSDLRLVVFGCEALPRVSANAACLLEGRRWDAALAAEAAEAVAAELDPMEDLNGDAETKRRQAAVLVRRALADLAGEGR